MPIAQIDLMKGMPASCRRTISHIVYQAMVLKAPTDDRVQVIAEKRQGISSIRRAFWGWRHSCPRHQPWPESTYSGDNTVTATFDRILTEIRDLAPAIAARVTDIEMDRRGAVDLVETLRLIGVFRVFVPCRWHGMTCASPPFLRSRIRSQRFCVNTSSTFMQSAAPGWTVQADPAHNIREQPVNFRRLFCAVERTRRSMLDAGPPRSTGQARHLSLKIGRRLSFKVAGRFSRPRLGGVNRNGPSSIASHPVWWKR
jgi:hypothetical protein